MKRKILLRFDDICPTMNFALFEKARKLVDAIEAKPLLGVIPDCRDPELQIEPYHEDFWDYIHGLRAMGYAIAMHGYHHVYDTNTRGKVQARFCSEFAGHSYEEQYEKLAKGKEAMEAHGLSTDIFFAPAHSYDDNTLRALGALGFRYISDGMSGKPYTLFGVTCIPCRSFGIPNIRGSGYYTAVIHCHEWVRPEKNDYARLKALCEKHTKEIVPWKDFIDRPVGDRHFQSAEEWGYVQWMRHLRPSLASVYHWAKGK